ncbi:hypothetical protein LGQ02_02720 [Bacillus shivajii]|uniref:DnaA ATPase domain-containing protein n=1 Tax=Bacillus shivajii TaxID=1983719 RepID=UPI001CFBC408|nr:DnaA/Hda family protein [Bacillus shivajii]UCZ53718.1 hypothetical protein LGQ02_02720 [Bacillus shivajii]
MNQGKVKLSNVSDACPFRECDGSGWVWYKDWALRTEPVRDEWKEECKCNQLKLNKLKISHSSVPEVFKDVRFSDFSLDVYKEEGREYAELAKNAAEKFVFDFSSVQDTRKGIYLKGKEKGSGKTRLLCSLSNEFNSKHPKLLAVYKTAEGILEEVKEKINQKRSTNPVFEFYSNVDLLIIDNFGLEMHKYTEWADNLFAKILNTRLENSRITCFASNSSIKELDDIYKKGKIRSVVSDMAIEVPMPIQDVGKKIAQNESLRAERILFSK